jgi:hypothetical protein
MWSRIPRRTLLSSLSDASAYPPDADVDAAPVDGGDVARTTTAGIHLRDRLVGRNARCLGIDHLFSELNRSGSTRTLNASFPVSLVIGNARSVTLHIDGVPYDLAPSTKVDVARLRLE